jgi:hypothetical protein
MAARITGAVAAHDDRGRQRDALHGQGGHPSGFYYFQAAAVFLAILPMAWFPRFAPLIFGMVAAACFFVTGLKFKLRRQQRTP